MPGFGSAISNNTAASLILALDVKQVQGIGIFDTISDRDDLPGGAGGVTPRINGYIAIVKDADGNGTTKAYIYTGGDSGNKISGEYVADTDWDAVHGNWSELSTFTEVSQDTSPQLGGNLDVNGNSITSASNGNITIDPNGTGNVLIGNFTFDADQSVGSGQDNYVLTYDNGTGLISLEAAAGGGGGINNVSEDTNPTLGGNLDAAGNNIIEVEDIGLRDRIYHDDDTDTFIQFVSNDAFRVVTGNLERMYLNGTSTVFNETGASVDFRVEGDTAQHLLFVDASADKVGIKNSTPSEALDVTGNIAVSGTVDGRDIASDGGKLDGIEALADVTDATNVTSSLVGATAISAGDKNTIQGNLDVDPSGTDNSTDVTLIGTPDYITISGQVITRNAIDVANDVTGTLPVANGGTGATSFTDKSVVITQDAGADTLSAVAMATNGQLLIGGTSGPSAATLTQGDNVTITNGDGTISIASSHPTISGAASSSDNSGRTYIQDITLDSNGHVTGLTTATETVTNTDSRINDVRDNDTSTTISSVASLRFTGALCSASGAGGVATVTVSGNIDRLNDVDDTISPAVGDVLIYNATSGKYEPQNLTEGSNITITNADGSITIAAPDYTAGDGLTLTGSDFDIDAAQTLITSVLNSSLKLGTSATQEYIDFGAVANTIRFLINNTGVLDITSGGLDVSGNIDVASNNLSVNGKVGDTANNDHISFETDGEINIMTNNVERMSVTDSGVEVNDLNTTRNIFEKTSNTDHDYQGDIVKFGSGTLQQGRICYYNNGTWAAADANAVVSSGGCLLGIALGSSPTTDGLLIKGMYTMAADMGTDGDELYISGSVGQITNTAPSANGDVVRVVGYCLDSTNGQIWFNPSSDWIEVSA